MSTKENTYELSEAQLKAVRNAFRFYDTRGEGHLPTSRLRDVMTNLGHTMSRDELRELVEVVDSDGSGTVEWEEFLPLLACYIKQKEELAFYKDLFRMLDKQHKGYVLVEDLRYILQGMAGEMDLTADDINEMVTAVDEDGDGRVSFEEFYKLMTD